MGLWWLAHHGKRMFKRDIDNEGFFLIVSPTELHGGSKVAGKRDRTQRVYISPEENPEIVRDVEELIERIEIEMDEQVGTNRPLPSEND